MVGVRVMGEGVEEGGADGFGDPFRFGVADWRGGVGVCGDAGGDGVGGVRAVVMEEGLLAGVCWESGGEDFGESGHTQGRWQSRSRRGSVGGEALARTLRGGGGWSGRGSGRRSA